MSKAENTSKDLPGKAEIRKAVIKTSTERLIAELSRGQDVLDDDEIAKLSRAGLVENVVQLRFSVGSLVPIQTCVFNFMPVEIDADISFLTDKSPDDQDSIDLRLLNEC